MRRQDGKTATVSIETVDGKRRTVDIEDLDEETLSRAPARSKGTESTREL